MTRAWLVWLVMTLGALGAAVPALAHHSFPAAYHENQRITVQGEIASFEYRNPHAWVHVMAPDERGEMQQYSAEWVSASRLHSQGVMAETLKPGDRVVIEGAPGRKAEEHHLHLKSIERLGDGWTWNGAGTGGRPGVRQGGRR